MDTKTLRCGLLGRKLGHSYSPAIHERLADYSYRLFEVEPEDLGAFLQEGAFDGLNVTIPYKKDVIPYCAGAFRHGAGHRRGQHACPPGGRDALGRQYRRLRLFHARTGQQRGRHWEKGARLRQRRRFGDGAVCAPAARRARGRGDLAARGRQL